MGRQKEIYHFLCLMIFSVFFGEIKSDNDYNNSNKSYEIEIYFQTNGLQSLYCDDNIQFFGTKNINFYYFVKIIKNKLIGGIYFPLPYYERTLIIV